MGKECENEKKERIVYFLCSGLLPPWACCGFYFHTGLMISREREEREKRKGLSHVLHVRGSGKIVLLYHVISLRKVLDFSQQEFHYINILLNRPLQLGMCCGSFLSLV